MNGSGNVGSLNVQLFFETLAKIISEREGVEVTVKSITYSDVSKRVETQPDP